MKPYRDKINGKITVRIFALFYYIAAEAVVRCLIIPVTIAYL
jgi:hypothetical protein